MDGIQGAEVVDAEDDKRRVLRLVVTQETAQGVFCFPTAGRSGTAGLLGDAQDRSEPLEVLQQRPTAKLDALEHPVDPRRLRR